MKHAHIHRLLLIVCLFGIVNGLTHCANADGPSAGTGEIAANDVWAVKSGTITLNGRPFFPLGIYHTTHFRSAKDRRLKDLETIADLGFNMIHTPIAPDDRALLDRAAELGLYVAVEFNGDSNEILSLFSDHSAVSFLTAFDDVDQREIPGIQRYSPEHVRETSASLKNVNEFTRKKLTYISGGYPKRTPAYVGSADLIAQQAYPIPSEPASSILTSYLKPISAATAQQGTSFISNLQTFGWDGEARYPSAAELRNMTYQSLIAGTNGIIYYTFYDSVTDLNTKPDLLAELKKLIGEMKDILPFLTEGKRTVLVNGKNEFYAARWDLNDRALIIAANSSYRSLRPSIKTGLSGLHITRVLTAPDSSKPPELAAMTITGNFSPLSVAVLELKKG